MRSNIYRCLLAFVLGSNATAEIIRKVFEEKQQVTLPCPRPDRNVTWSRKVNGSRADILTIDGDNDKRYNDTLKRFSSLSDKSLTFNKAVVSDSGTYFCNSEAVELTVIPSGTIKHNATERTSITLQCPHAVGRSGSPTWSREIAGKQQPIRHLPPTVAGTLTITEVQLGDYGLYYCDGKPAVYLNVTKGQTSTTTTTTSTNPPTTSASTTTSTTTTSTNPPTTSASTTTSTTTTSTKPPTTTTPTTSTTTSTVPTTATVPTKNPTTQTSSRPANKQMLPGLVIGTVVILLLLLLIFVCFLWRRRSKRRGTEEKAPVYEEIQVSSVCQPSNESSKGITNTYCMVTFPGRSNQEHIQPSMNFKQQQTTLPVECPYSLIVSTSLDGDNKGSSQLTDNTYYSLE